MLESIQPSILMLTNFRPVDWQPTRPKTNNRRRYPLTKSQIRKLQASAGDTDAPLRPSRPTSMGYIPQGALSVAPAKSNAPPTAPNPTKPVSDPLQTAPALEPPQTAPSSNSRQGAPTSNSPQAAPTPNLPQTAPALKPPQTAPTSNSPQAAPAVRKRKKQIPEAPAKRQKRNTATLPQPSPGTRVLRPRKKEVNYNTKYHPADETMYVFSDLFLPFLECSLSLYFIDMSC